MSHFKNNHHDIIIIDNFEMSMDEFMIEEPGYVKPKNCIAREYFVGKKDLAYTPEYQSQHETGEEKILDGYIAKLPIYKTNIEARRQLKQNIKDDKGYAPDLAKAKRRRKKKAKREAMDLFLEYQASDLELTQAELNAYKSDLIAQKRIIGPEIDALSTVQQVREYKYTNWPPEP